MECEERTPQTLAMTCEERTAQTLAMTCEERTAQTLGRTTSKSAEWVQETLERKRPLLASRCVGSPYKLRRDERKGQNGRRGKSLQKEEPQLLQGSLVAVDHVWGLINLQLTSGTPTGLPRSPNCP